MRRLFARQYSVLRLSPILLPHINLSYFHSNILYNTPIIHPNFIITDSFYHFKKRITLGIPKYLVFLFLLRHYHRKPAIYRPKQLVKSTSPFTASPINRASFQLLLHFEEKENEYPYFRKLTTSPETVYDQFKLVHNTIHPSKTTSTK